MIKIIVLLLGYILDFSTWVEGKINSYYIGQIYGGDFAKNLWPSQNI